MYLGEAVSKCEHLAGVPLRPATARELNQIYLAKGVLATTAIEGNTLSEEEVRKLLEGELKLPPSREYLAHEVKNIINACNRITDELESVADKVTPDRIKLFNKWVLEGLELEKDVIPGNIRLGSVTVGSYRGAPAADCAYLLDRLCEWLNGDDFLPKPGMEMAFAILKAIIAHLYIAWIHPFGDGNGRTARLLEVEILLCAGVPTPAAHLLSDHYNQTRADYYRLLAQSIRPDGGPIPFIEYALRGFVDGLKEQLGKIREQQYDVTWRSYVHEQFRDKTKRKDKRQRDLLLDLSAQPDLVPIQDIVNLTPRLAGLYSRLKAGPMRTLKRDLNELHRMKLVEFVFGSVSVNREIILAFLPRRKAKR